MKAELLPCPFCGAHAKEPWNMSSPAQRPLWQITCSQYCVSMSCNTKKDVIADWNTRVKISCGDYDQQQFERPT